jgi:hypothetical protein
MAPTIDLMLQRARDAKLLWYENGKGDKFFPNLESKELIEKQVPAGYSYQYSRLPGSLRESVLLVKDGKSTPVASGEKTYMPELVLALCRPLHREQALQLGRYGSVMLGLTFDQAVIAASSCERCMNAFAHRAGLDWGYPVGSTRWQKAGTSCDLCAGPEAETGSTQVTP